MSPKQIAKIAKALADETRLNVYESIAAQDEVNCGDICSIQVVGHATVSHHLRILAEAALVDSRRQGQFVYYRALRETVDDFVKALSAMAKTSTAVS